MKSAIWSAINNLAADLQRYRDTRQEFFANISHELRTPITYLEGYAKVVKNHMYETEEEKDRYLDIIYQEGVRIQHLVDDLFELAKMEEGKISLSMEWIDLRYVIHQSVQKVSLKAKEKGLELVVHPTESVPFIRGDGMRLEQIALNLLENAIRYTDEGRIDVYLHHSSTMLTLSIQDTGIGIPDDELPISSTVLSCREVQITANGRDRARFVDCQKLVKPQGGSIHVTSRVGKGTCVTVQFVLPMMQEDK